MNELKPCPFCPDGGEPEMRHTKTWDYFVKCRKCGARTRNFHENENGASSSWNTRYESAEDEIKKGLQHGLYGRLCGNSNYEVVSE